MSRILVADDALYARKVMVEMLEAGGHDVVGEAGSGDATVRLWDELDPDLAIVDLNMPGGGGLGAAAAIRETYPDARVIVASVLVDPTRLLRANEVGAVDYVMKPCTSHELLGAVDRALSR